MYTLSPHSASRPARADLIRYTGGPCALGAFLVARSQQGVCALLLGDNERQLRQALHDEFPAVALERDVAGLMDLAAKAAAIAQAPDASGGFDEPLDAGGTPFQRRVWQALREVAPGQTASYVGVARRIGAPAAARAVAAACAANRIAIVIPCHRVVRADGRATGYRWGARRRAWLLQHEAAG